MPVSKQKNHYIMNLKNSSINEFIPKVPTMPHNIASMEPITPKNVLIIDG